MFAVQRNEGALRTEGYRCIDGVCTAQRVPGRQLCRRFHQFSSERNNGVACAPGSLRSKPLTQTLASSVYIVSAAHGDHGLRHRFAGWILLQLIP